MLRGYSLLFKPIGETDFVQPADDEPYRRLIFRGNDVLILRPFVNHIEGMSVNRQIQTLHIRAAEQRSALAGLKQLAVDIERCQETITSVLAELSSANEKFQDRRATRQEVEYLTILLACAKKKLAWEKQIASLQKRAPALMENMSRIMHERDFPPAEELKTEILHSLEAIRAALARLQVPEAGE